MKVTSSRQVFLQGDIAVLRDRNAIACQSCLWKKSSSGLVEVPYIISNTFNSLEKALLAAAMEEFSTLTCLRFINRTTEKDYLNIESKDGCWSYVGRLGGPQDVSLLKSRCLHHGVIQHELVHSLGFEHEQCRSDRDRYIRVIWRNIGQHKEMNFYKHKTRNLGVAYDYSSVMHYGKYAFAANMGKPTLEPRANPKAMIGQRFGLSALDVVKLNKLYQCRTCSFLLPESQGTFSSPNITSLDSSNSTCVWLIRTQEQKVLLEFEYVDIVASPGCASNFIRVFDGQSPHSSLLLPSVCGQKPLPALVGSGNTLLIEWATSIYEGHSNFKAKYSSVTCGGSLVAPQGNFSSPGFPVKYPNGENCVWIISAPPGHMISLTIGPMALELSAGCAYDYVLVRDEPYRVPAQEGRMCGRVSSRAFNSSDSSLRVQFRSDESVPSYGFLATYTFTPST
ncbi:embryonic protein UVS.2-like [Ambystoma mexicanum]|uniref:embryonic protein UVS.2-like n=1 Tax=Ambystoma mexicanum TaxID=8296 RepID=UPI0037E8B4E2